MAKKPSMEKQSESATARAPARAPAKPAPTVDEATLRMIATVMADTGLTEVEVRDGARALRISRQPAGVTALPHTLLAHAGPAFAAGASSGMPASASAPGGDAAVGGGTPKGALTSPMVGTAYLSPEPGTPPFVQLGDTVKEGQTLLIIEAMKVMNPIPAPRAGTVRQVLVENGAPVEYGEPLLVID